ncbi:hypothetical protein [Vibrio harveyi]|uniref:hypothetical protein n=1 Tax=Vibrio harveyi TaxID=669 RepID=UPI003CF9427D
MNFLKYLKFGLLFSAFVLSGCTISVGYKSTISNGMDSVLMKVTYPNSEIQFVSFYKTDPKDVTLMANTDKEKTYKKVPYHFNDYLDQTALTYPVMVNEDYSKLSSTNFHVKVAANQEILAIEVESSECREMASSTEINGSIEACGVTFDFHKSEGIEESSKTYFKFD